MDGAATVDATRSAAQDAGPVVVVGLALGGCGYNTIPTAEENAKAK